MATESQDYIEPQPVLASPKDPHGFDPNYQRVLRLRIICERLAAILGPITPIDTVSHYYEITTVVDSESPNHKKTEGVVLTHIAPNLVTSNVTHGGERLATRRTSA